MNASPLIAIVVAIAIAILLNVRLFMIVFKNFFTKRDND